MRTVQRASDLGPLPAAVEAETTRAAASTEGSPVSDPSAAYLRRAPLVHALGSLDGLDGSDPEVAEGTMKWLKDRRSLVWREHLQPDAAIRPWAARAGNYVCAV
jgi:hypothetical protein